MGGWRERERVRVRHGPGIGEGVCWGVLGCAGGVLYGGLRSGGAALCSGGVLELDCPVDAKVGTSRVRCGYSGREGPLSRPTPSSPQQPLATSLCHTRQGRPFSVFRSHPRCNQAAAPAAGQTRGCDWSPPAQSCPSRVPNWPGLLARRFSQTRVDACGRAWPLRSSHLCSHAVPLFVRAPYGEASGMQR